MTQNNIVFLSPESVYTGFLLANKQIFKEIKKILKSVPAKKMTLREPFAKLISKRYKTSLICC